MDWLFGHSDAKPYIGQTILIHSGMVKAIFFLTFGSMIVFPQFLIGQRFVSLENSGKFKRIRLEEGMKIKVKERRSDYLIPGVITRITKDSIYFGPTGVEVDSILFVSLPPGKNAQYWLTFLAAGVPGSFLVAILTLSNNIHPSTRNKRNYPVAAAYTGLGLGLLFLVVKLSRRNYKIGPHWELKVMEVPVFQQ